LFEEHYVYNQKELMVDFDVAFEQLGDYLASDDTERTKSQTAMIEDADINKLIERKAIVERIVPKFENYSEHMLNIKDTNEYNKDSEKKKKYELKI